MGVFGSTLIAHDCTHEAGPVDSDIDVLVEFASAPTVDSYFGAKDYLEAVLGRPVDLVTPGGLKPRAHRYVERDLVRVA